MMIAQEEDIVRASHLAVLVRELSQTLRVLAPN